MAEVILMTPGGSWNVLVGKLYIFTGHDLTRDEDAFFRSVEAGWQ